MTISFIFVLPPALMGALLGIVGVWLAIMAYKFVASLIVRG